MFCIIVSSSKLESLPHSALQPYLVSIVCHWYVLIKVDYILICYQLFKHLVEHNRMVLIGFRCKKSSMAEEERLGLFHKFRPKRPESRMQSPMKRSPLGHGLADLTAIVCDSQSVTGGQFHCCGTQSNHVIPCLCQNKCVKCNDATLSIPNRTEYDTVSTPSAMRHWSFVLVPVVSQLELAADSLPQRPARGHSVPGGGQSTPMGT